MKTILTFAPPVRRVLCGLLVAAVAALAWPLSSFAGDEPLTEHQKIIHALNRLGYGPRPGDVERVGNMCLDAYLEQQLHPERIDVSALDQKLADLKTLQLGSRELMEEFAAEIRRSIERQREAGANAPPGGTPPRPTREQMMQPKTAMQVLGELQTSKIIRAIESEQQLYEVLVDFWANHFNVDVKKGPVRVLKPADEREVIRPHVLGKFRDLLGASAHSPAMLFYLDNVLNSAPREMSVFEQRTRAKIQEKMVGQAVDPEMAKATRPVREGGLNENYGRELLELHTLGVDGGYTQKDVIEVSRCFTGWGMERATGRFQFLPFRHDQGEKTVLGHTIPANGGQRDGELVLDIIASHPSTAKFIATKLCQRLVADEPPASLVEEAAKTFRDTGGDLRRVVETIITSPEFFSPAAFRAKIKSPFEYAVSSVRALGGRIGSSDAFSPMPAQMRYTMEGAASAGFGAERIAAARRKSLNLHIFEMGQPLYSYQAPTGWPEDSRKWVSSGALIARLNFALAFTAAEVLDVTVQPRALLAGVDTDDSDAVLDWLEKNLVPAGLSPATRQTLRKQLPAHEARTTTTVNVPQLVAFVLGSPEFQRR